MCKFQKRKYILNLTLVIGMNLKCAGTRNRGGSSHQRAGFSPASAVWPSRGLHILQRDKAEKPTGIDVYEFVPFASDFLLTFKLDGESCLFLQLFCQNQLLQRRAGWAAAGRGFSPADGGSHLYLPSLFPLWSLNLTEYDRKVGTIKK